MKQKMHLLLHDLSLKSCILIPRGCDLSAGGIRTVHFRLFWIYRIERIGSGEQNIRSMTSLMGVLLISRRISPGFSPAFSAMLPFSTSSITDGSFIKGFGPLLNISRVFHIRFTLMLQVFLLTNKKGGSI